MNAKEKGEVFTPDYIVKFMLDKIDYNDKNIIYKTIMEPAAGEGAFIQEIIRRLVLISKKNNITNENILNIILNSVYAYEIEESYYEILIRNVIALLSSEINALRFIDKKHLNIAIKKNFLSKDTLLFNDDKKYDLIIGNPPYIRRHNLSNEKIKAYRKYYSSMKKGNVDIYFAFYEWAINHIKDSGTICFITPNSFLKSESGEELRNLLKEKLHWINDFGSEIIFPGISTYNSIITLKNHCENFIFESNKISENVIVKNDVKFTQYILKNKICIGFNADELKKDLQQVPKNILHFKNGLATLSDKIFITENIEKINDKYFKFNGYQIEAELLKDVIKISTYWGKNKKEKIIFPYKIVNNKVIAYNEKELQINFPWGYKYFCHFKKELSNRALEKKELWFLFGRSQGINSILHKKVIIKTLVKDEIEHAYIGKNKLVYSGLYSEMTNSKSELTELLEAKSLSNFIQLMGFDRQGNYKSINSTILKEYFNE